jgi:hypothetical protein
MNAEFDYVFQPDLLQRVAVSEFSTTTYTHTRTQSTNKINILKKGRKKEKKKKKNIQLQCQMEILLLFWKLFSFFADMGAYRRWPGRL